MLAELLQGYGTSFHVLCWTKDDSDCGGLQSVLDMPLDFDRLCGLKDFPCGPGTEPGPLHAGVLPPSTTSKSPNDLVRWWVIEMHCWDFIYGARACKSL